MAALLIMLIDSTTVRYVFGAVITVFYFVAIRLMVLRKRRDGQT